ncbi:MAG: hypothetical protein CO128_08105 [Ignavibacteriales bacterium CG_4_9_14_3_um_filter_30_11]|nr:MAG: hypothetical protein CO128_08105 [Ignavibacteriales bacterium CG_4_9_14_3_um_filter_30_11]
MNIDINKKLEILENNKAQLLNCFESISGEKLNTQLEKDKWSPAQIIYHVVKSEQYTLISLMNSSKPETKLRKIGFKAFGKSKLLNLFLKSRLKFKAPPIVQKVPDDVNVKDILAKWDEVRNEIKNVCLKFPKENFNKGVFKHPYIGFINLEQSLNFLINHLKHHTAQIEKISINFKQ